MSPAPKKAGYEIGRDEDGLTQRERTVRDLAVEGKTIVAIGEALGFSKQRASKIVNDLISKGVLARVEGRIVRAEKTK